METIISDVGITLQLKVAENSLHTKPPHISSFLSSKPLLASIENKNTYSHSFEGMPNNHQKLRKASSHCDRILIAQGLL